MKLSSKILIGLFALILVGYISNLVYNGYQLRKKAPVLAKKSLLEARLNDIQVVWVNSPDNLLSYKFRVEIANDKYNFKSEQQEEDFYRNAVLKGDTLFVNSKAAYLKNRDVYGAEYYLGLPNIKRFYFNGQIVKTY